MANKYGVALRLDNYSVPGLRLGLSGYYGESIGNSYPRNANGVDAEYKGQVLIGAFDFTYNAHNWIVRGQADYGYLGDADQLKYVYNRTNKKSPYHHSAFVSKNAYAVGIEAGYDVFSQISRLRNDDQKFYVFGRYEQYNPYASKTKGTAYDYTEVKRLAFGVNYYPVPEIAIKAEYSNRLLKSQYNNEPSVSIGVAYEEDVRELIEMCGDRRVYLVTCRVPLALQDMNNELFYEVAADYDNCEVIDWYGTSAGHDEYFWDDGTHLRPEGAEAYCLMLREAIVGR